MNPTQRSFEVARALLDCICLALNSTSAGCPSRSCIVPGAEIEFVNCCGSKNGGQLTINLESVYNSRQFPVPDTVANNCDAPYEVAAYSVTILRCSPSGDIDHAPTCEALEAAAFTTFVDQRVVREAVQCCLSDTSAFESVAGFDYRWVLDENPTIGPEGGCAGSTLRVLIGWMTCHNCTAVGL